MSEHQRKYQHLSKLVAALPENMSPVRYIACFQEAVRGGDIVAVPLGGSFSVGRLTCKEDMVRADEVFNAWHERTVRSLGLYRERRGVAAHEADVLSGTVDFDELAERYRQQLVSRANVKRPKRQVKRGKPKLVPGEPGDSLAAQPAPVIKGSKKAGAEIGPDNEAGGVVVQGGNEESQAAATV